MTRRRTIFLGLFLASASACGRPAGAPGPVELQSVQIPIAPPAAPPKPKVAKKPASPPMPPKPTPPPTFADDLAFLEKHGGVHLLEGPKGELVATSAKYQGRVMTSAVERGGRSFGWINRSFIADEKTGTPFDNYGG